MSNPTHSRMRVTHVAPTLFGEEGLFGGGERYPLELAKRLARHLDCRLVGFGSTSHRIIDPSGLEIIVLRSLHHVRGHIAHPIATGLSGATRGADIVHVHQMRSAPARMMALISAARRQPIVVTDHGLGGGGWFGLLPRCFDAFLPVSRYSAETLGAPEAKTSVVFGGADTDRFKPDEAAREGLLFVGRLTPHKGVDRLLRALPNDVSLTVVGTTGHDGDSSARSYPRLLRELAQGKAVKFVERLDDDLLPGVYRRARALVLPSVHDTCYGSRIEISELLGLTALEAMASGTPVICSGVGGLPEIVSHGITGLVVEPGDVPGLRAAIEALVSDPTRADNLGRAGRRRVVAEFTWEECARRCLVIYESLLARGLGHAGLRQCSATEFFPDKANYE
jgi:glycosyltransferase involved in cell wall biosynthesis